ncbi:MAG: VOC family protein [Dehalococcoidia bacterium]|nr:VOC family protein [Dehalococcoidia bacterium]
MSYLKFAHVGITCRDPIKVEKFYTKYLGFKRALVIPLGGTEQIVMLKSDEAYVELFSAKEESPVPPPENDGPQYPGLRHIAFHVDNLDATLAEIGNNAKVTLGPLAFDEVIPGWRAVWIADPEGNIIELSQGYQDEEIPPALV